MLAKEFRLCKKKDFEEILKKGKGVREAFFVLKVKKTGEGKMRFGFIVSQKVSKKAVIRNRVKRRFRSAVQEELGCGKNPKNSTKCFQKSMDVVLIALPAAKEKSFAEIHEGVKRAFGRVGVLN